MRIPQDAVIPWNKLTEYLLRPRPHGDKSAFLARAGFSSENPEALLQALREFATLTDAVEDGYNEYGVFFRQEGILIGPNGRALAVALIWLRWRVDGTMHFITLLPHKEKRT